MTVSIFILWFLYVVKNVDVKKKLTTVLLLLHLIWFSMLVSLISVIIYIYMYRSIWSLMCLLLINVCVHTRTRDNSSYTHCTWTMTVSLLTSSLKLICILMSLLICVYFKYWLNHFSIRQWFASSFCVLTPSASKIFY